MADEPQIEESPSTPEAAEDVITLLAAAEVGGDVWLKGKVLRAPRAEAQALIAAGKARLATDLDKQIAGV